MEGDEKIVCFIDSAQKVGISISSLTTRYFAIYFTTKRIIVARALRQTTNMANSMVGGTAGAGVGGLAGDLLGGKRGAEIGGIIGAIAGGAVSRAENLAMQKQNVSEQASMTPDQILGQDKQNFQIQYSNVSALYIKRNALAVASASIKIALKVETVDGKKYSFIIGADSMADYFSSAKITYESYIKKLQPLLGGKLKENQWKNF